MNTQAKQHEIIVSITTTSGRIGHLQPVVRSLMEQSLSMDSIILWISRDAYLFDEGIPDDRIPGFLVKEALAPSGRLEIRYTENTGPYRKLLPLLAEKKRAGDNSCVIVTADDDIIYSRFWLEGLYATFLRYRCVTAYRIRRIMRDDNRNPLPYSQWPFVEDGGQGPDPWLCPTGRNGVLYQPSFFTGQILDRSYLSLSPSRCDIWFSAAAIANDVWTIAASGVGHPMDFRKAPRGNKAIDGKLWKHNRALNDGYIRNTFRHFKLL